MCPMTTLRCRLVAPEARRDTGVPTETGSAALNRIIIRMPSSREVFTEGKCKRVSCHLLDVGGLVVRDVCCGKVEHLLQMLM